MFVPLHVKSDYSLGYGTATVDELVEHAAVLGHTSLALTDIETLAGQVRFHQACRARGLRPVTGIELRPDFEGGKHVGGRASRVVLLAADSTGYGSLCRIVSRRRASAESIATDPIAFVMAEHEGLFALSDDLSVVERLVSEGFLRGRVGLLLLRPAHLDVRTYQDTATRLGVRLVADLDAVFANARDHDLHLMQRAIHEGVSIEDARTTDGEGPERWLRPPHDAAALFEDVPEAVAEAARIAEACQLTLDASFGELPALDLPPAITPEAALRQRCDEELARRDSSGVMWSVGYQRRLENELGVFGHLGLSGFILLVDKILTHCRDVAIPVTARGSAVSSLTLHLLGATPVDPILHDLIFERFLHAGKTTWPDVDLDLPWHRRDEVIAWVYEHFGHDRVAMVAAYHTFQRRAALRDGLKAWGLHAPVIEALTRALPPEDLPIEQVDFIGLADVLEKGTSSNANVRGTMGEGLALAQRLIGRIRHVAAHPGGMVIGRRPLAETLPLEHAPKGVVITQYDLAAVAGLGLAKIDLLGNRALSELEETLERTGHDARRLDAVPGEDPATLELIDRAETVGCFQLESPAMRSLLARLPIRRQSDIIAALALIRPGAATGQAKAAFIRRAWGEERDELLDPVLAERLAETHGVLLYEEDVMRLLSGVGGLSMGEADELRAAIIATGGNAEELAAIEADFVQRANAYLGENQQPGAPASNAPALGGVSTTGSAPPKPSGLEGGSREDEFDNRARRAWAAAAQFAAYSQYEDR